jgi:hypothetical protein
MSDKFSFLSHLLGRAAAGPEYRLAENYVLLRDMVFTMRPEAIGIIAPHKPEDIWGVVMEQAYPEALVTLVALADGSVSLYFSNGGGIIGMGSHARPQRAAQALLAAAPEFRQHCQPTTKYPLPQKNHVHFYLFTHHATLTAEAREQDLLRDHNPLSPLFHKAHELITEIRLIDEKQEGKHEEKQQSEQVLSPSSGDNPAE